MRKQARFDKPSRLKKANIPKPEIHSLRPKWRFSYMDWIFSRENLDAEICNSGTKFSSNEPKIKCCLHLLAEKLKSYESLTWGEITNNDSTGSHFISLTELKSHNRAMHDKFETLAIGGALDEPFSLRLEGKDRLWGIILSDGTFEAVCYDPEHKGWPITR